MREKLSGSLACVDGILFLEKLRDSLNSKPALMRLYGIVDRLDLSFLAVS